MKIEFDPDDLKPKFKELSAYQVSYKHLNAKAQKVLNIAGRDVFYSWDRMTHNAIRSFMNCPRCKGVGLIPIDMNRGGKCWRCNGKGIVRPKKS
jgi:DnaJ-class molecular chaperone